MKSQKNICACLLHCIKNTLTCLLCENTRLLYALFTLNSNFMDACLLYKKCQNFMHMFITLNINYTKMSFQFHKQSYVRTKKTIILYISTM